MDKYAFGNRLCALRMDKGYTQEKLGKMLGVSNKAVSKWENGTSQPRLQMLDKIAECFDMSVEELLEYGDSTRNESIEATNEKELNTDMLNEVASLPKASLKMISGFGWIRIDGQEFISRIKEERHLTNKEIASIFGTTEKTIGIWENGLKQPSRIVSAQIATFYYNNCNDETKMNSFIDATFGYRILEKIIKFFFTIICLVIVSLVVPIMIIDEGLYEMYAFNSISSFSIKGYFILLFPVSVITCSVFMLFKSIKLNRPEVKDILKKYRYFLATVTCYSSIICFLFAEEKTLGIILPVSFLIIHLSRYINFKISNIYNMIIRDLAVGVCLIISAVIIDHITAYIFEITTPFCTYDEYVIILLFVTMIAYLTEYIVFEIDRHQDIIKPYFPLVKKEYVKLPKRDSIISAVIILSMFALFLALECNKEYVYNFVGQLTLKS